MSFDKAPVNPFETADQRGKREAGEAGARAVLGGLTGCAKNTDREIWREREGDYYAHSIHVTEGGSIGLNCGGTVIVKPVREWHQQMAFAESKNNVCILLRDACRILEDGPDDSDKARAEAKLGEAMALARIVCKEQQLP